METKNLEITPISTNQLYWRIKAVRAKNAVVKFLSRALPTFLTLLLEALMMLFGVIAAIVVGIAIGVITVTSLVTDWACEQMNKIRTLK